MTSRSDQDVKWLEPIIHGAFICVIGVLFLLYMESYQRHWSILLFVEVGALAVVGALASANYLSLGAVLKKAVEDTKPFKLEFFRGCNSVFCLLAIVSIHYPVLHLGFIAAIYALFCFANLKLIEVLYKASGSPTNRQVPADQPKVVGENEYNIVMAMGVTWLREENGPALVGYMCALWVIVVFTVLEFLPEQSYAHALSGIDFDALLKIKEVTSLQLDQGKGEKFLAVIAPQIIKAQLKSLAAGIATFHLVLSVFKYRYVIRTEHDLQELLIRWWLSVGTQDQTQILRTRITPHAMKQSDYWKPKTKKLLGLSALCVLIVVLLNIANH